LALGIRDVKPLFLRLTDAETIPSTLDTPLQSIKLRHLGLIAFALGFQEVNIDPANRSFRAYSSMGTITTEEVPVVGKVLRFEGDVLSLHGLVARTPLAWTKGSLNLVLGRLTFGQYNVNGISIPLGVLSNAIKDSQDDGDYSSREKETLTSHRRGFSAGPVLRESMLLRDLLTERLHLDQMAKPGVVGGWPGLLVSWKSRGLRTASGNPEHR
jgi:hypothetical protein